MIHGLAREGHGGGVAPWPPDFVKIRANLIINNLEFQKNYRKK